MALHLKLGFKVVVEWTSPKKYGPMCSFYGILARCDQNGLSASQGRDRSVKFDFLAYGSRPRWVIASGNAFAIVPSHRWCARLSVRRMSSLCYQARFERPSKRSKCSFTEFIKLGGGWIRRGGRRGRGRFVWLGLFPVHQLIRCSFCF